MTEPSAGINEPVSDVNSESASVQNESGPPKRAKVKLPAYLLRQQDGIYVDLAAFPVGGGFEVFVDRLFGSYARFSGLNYRLFSNLLYFYGDILASHGTSDKLKLADDVMVFSVERKKLYKGVKLAEASQSAQYFFEPATINVITEEKVYGEPDENGVAPVLEIKSKSETKSVSLDLDEFITDMWTKGVRFGINVEAVGGVIARNEMVRMDVATQVDATPGQDAEIVEASELLHRDNSPQIINGIADLRKFKNRFPQVDKETRLLKKKPRVLGKHGCKISGEIIEPEIPKDIDISSLAGPGTRVAVLDGFDFILANRDGFIALDVNSNLISVTEKIENKAGISLKTTGDLSLAGSEYVEHGEVQEGRVVEGKNMTFHSDVYGKVVSQEGLIQIEGNLSRGSAVSHGGDIASGGRVLNSDIEAWEGKVSVKYAETSVILGESVFIERAVNCDIVGDNIQIGSAEGCFIAGKNVKIDNSTSCRGKETIVFMVVPDLQEMDAQLGKFTKAINECKKIIAGKDKLLSQIKSNEEVAKYFSFSEKIEQGLVKLNEAQQDNWLKISSKFTKFKVAVDRLNADRKEQFVQIESVLEEQAFLKDVRQNNSSGIRCVLGKVVGDTMVRTMIIHGGIADFHNNTSEEVKIRLREQGLKRERIFTNDTGSLDWSFVAPPIVESTE